MAVHAVLYSQMVLGDVILSEAKNLPCVMFAWEILRFAQNDKDANAFGIETMSFLKYWHWNIATSVPGIYAIGDIRKNSSRQVSTAVGDGATAAINAFKYIQEKC